MLDTQTLCARVIAPARAKPRSLYVTAASKDWADSLRTQGLADKTTTRVLTDAVLAVLDGSGAETLFKRHQDRVDGPVVKVQLSLREDTWTEIDALAERLDVNPSHFVRVICHAAMEQVVNELTGR